MEINVLDLGRMAYAPCVEVQRGLVEDVIKGDKPSTLIFVEHDPVITLGANYHEENLLLTAKKYKAKGIEISNTDRGGDVTFHGPGQLVMYPIFNLAEAGKDLHKWLRDLEETMLLTLYAYGLDGQRFPPNTGAWVENRKIAAIGIKVKKWVSMHGIALNCDIDLAPFKSIVPCGIKDFGVTSLTEELGLQITIEDAKPIVKHAFQQVFQDKKRP